MIVVRFPQPTHFKARQGEWVIAALLLAWAVNLALAPAAFSQPTFVVIRSFAPVHTWTVVCLLIALIRLGALYINGAWKASPAVRATTAVLSGLFWLAIGAGIWGSHVANTGVPVYLGLASFDLYGAYQAGKDARMTWERGREASDASARLG